MEDLTKILNPSTQQARLCNNPILVSVDELQKVVANSSRDKVNPKEPPSIISTTTSVQILVPTSPVPSARVDTFKIVDTMLQKLTIEEDKDTSTRKT